MNDNITSFALTRRNFLAGTAAALLGVTGAASLTGCAPAGQPSADELADTGETTLKEPTATRDADIVIVGSGAAAAPRWN